MATEYNQDQMWKLYERLPEELKETIFSEGTADSIFDICVKNGVNDKRISEVARYTGRVLLGVLPPTELQKTIEKEIKLEEGAAKNIVQEINRIIFAPVRSELARLYKKELPQIPREKIKKSSKADTYREPIE